MQTVKKLLRTFLDGERLDTVRRLRARWARPTAYRYDGQRFMAASSAGRGCDDEERLAAHIVKDFHSIEKGLALPKPRPMFGKGVVARLMSDVAVYESLYGTSKVTLRARDALSAYVAYNGEGELTALCDFLSRGATSERAEAGVDTLSEAQLFPCDTASARRFLESRRSARIFTGQAVPQEAIRQAVGMAQRVPSVCNRQSARVFATTDPETMKEVLSFQNGNRGFGDTLGAVFIVASDLRAFTSLGERNQPWVDGGIFAMGLVNALHALHIGACMLNWSVEPGRDKAMRRRFGIGDHYAVITMIGAGYVPETFNVAMSPRRDISDVVMFLEAVRPADGAPSLASSAAPAG